VQTLNGSAVGLTRRKVWWLAVDDTLQREGENKIEFEYILSIYAEFLHRWANPDDEEEIALGFLTTMCVIFKISICSKPAIPEIHKPGLT